MNFTIKYTNQSEYANYKHERLLMNLGSYFTHYAELSSSRHSM